MIKNTTYRWAIGLCALLLVAATAPLSASDAALPPGADFQEGFQGSSVHHREKRGITILPRAIKSIRKGGHRYLGKIKFSKALPTMEKFLGEDYKSLGNGRFVSKDGLRQVRYGNHEALAKIPHIHLESRKHPYGRFTEKGLAELID